MARASKPATQRQLSYMGDLAKQVDPSADIRQTLIRFGCPQNEWTGACATPSASTASYLIGSMLRTLASRKSSDSYLRDPGEDAADRWSETH